MKGQPGHDNKDRKAASGELKTRVLGHDSWERTAGTEQPETTFKIIWSVEKKRIGWPKHDSNDRTNETGQLRQDNHGRTTMTGQ
jgi:hypothetical protein